MKCIKWLLLCCVENVYIYIICHILFFSFYLIIKIIPMWIISIRLRKASCMKTYINYKRRLLLKRPSKPCGRMKNIIIVCPKLILLELISFNPHDHITTNIKYHRYIDLFLSLNKSLTPSVWWLIKILWMFFHSSIAMNLLRRYYKLIFNIINNHLDFQNKYTVK